MRKGRDREKKEKKKNGGKMATNIVASPPSEGRPTGTPTARPIMSRATGAGGDFEVY